MHLLAAERREAGPIAAGDRVGDALELVVSAKGNEGCGIELHREARRDRVIEPGGQDESLLVQATEQVPVVVREGGRLDVLHLGPVARVLGAQGQLDGVCRPVGESRPRFPVFTGAIVFTAQVPAEADPQIAAVVRVGPQLAGPASGPARGRAAAQLRVGGGFSPAGDRGPGAVLVLELSIGVDVVPGAQKVAGVVPIEPLVDVELPAVEDAERIALGVADPGELVELVGVAHEARVVDLEAGGSPGHSGLEHQLVVARAGEAKRAGVPGQRGPGGIERRRVVAGPLIVAGRGLMGLENGLLAAANLALQQVAFEPVVTVPEVGAEVEADCIGLAAHAV